MSTTLRRRLFLAGTAACIAVPAAVAVAQADAGAGSEPLVSTLRIDAPAAAGAAPTVHFTVRNASSEAVDVLSWDLPGRAAARDLLAVSRDGARVPYLGPLVKRGAPKAGDYIHLTPGSSYSTTVDLAAGYDLTRPGTYSVRLASAEARVQDPAVTKAAAAGAPALPPTVGVRPGAATFRTSTGVPVSGKAARQRPGGSTGTAAAASTATATASGVKLTFRGCSTSRQNALRQAVSDAAPYTASAANWLSAHPSGGGLYKTWFGSYNSSRFAKVSNYYPKIYGELTGKSVTLDCTSTWDVYAYVYPDQAYTIYLGTGYWNAPARGYDSKAGTLIHESSHFYVNGGAVDNVYGITEGQQLASRDPAAAVANADNVEHFAESL